MGVGGLLKDVGARPRPRAKAAAPRPPRPPIATVVLAAGRSSRMAPQHKLLVADRAGKPMVARVVDNLLAAPCRPLIVVVGHRQDDVRAALHGRPVTFVEAPDWETGLSASLRAAISAVPPEARAAIIGLGDMPLVTARVIERLIAAYDPDEGRLIVAPTWQGELGNPVLWDRRFFTEMMDLHGDRGARALLERHAEYVATAPMDDDAVLRDADTAEQLAALPGFMRAG
jgi:molybdenum cofactor cytidylyltransferase